MSLVQVWPGIGLSVRKENAGPGIYYVPGEFAQHTTYIDRRVSQGDLYYYDPSAPPPYVPFIDEQSVFIGRTSYDLRTERGRNDGATTATTGRATPGDGNGALLRWNATDTRSDDGVSIFGTTGVTGRWNAIGTVSPGSGSSFGGVVLALTSDTTISGSGLTDATTVLLQPNANRIARAMTRPASTASINTRQVFNDSIYDITIPNEDTTGTTATDRFLTDDGASKIFASKTWATVAYDYSAASGVGRWRFQQASPRLTSVAITVATNGTLTDPTLPRCGTVNLATSAVRTLYGIAFAASAFPSKTLVNTSAFDITLPHNSGSAVSGEKLKCPSGIDFVLTAGASCYVDYDFATGVWIVTAPESVMRGLLCSDLFSLRGAQDGAIVTCIGWYSSGNPSIGVTGNGDAGGGTFRWYASSTATVDGGLVFGPATIVSGAVVPTGGAPNGRWHRIYYSSTQRNVRWFGARALNSAPAAGVVSDTNAFQASLDSANTNGCTIDVPEGIYWIDRTVKFPSAGSYSHVTLRGRGTSAQCYWHGPNTQPGAITDPMAPGYTNGEDGSVLFQLAGVSHTIENLYINVGGGCHAGAGINIGYSPGDTVNALTGCIVRGCSVSGASSTYGARSMRYGVVLDMFAKQHGNCENVLIENTGIDQTLTANIWLVGNSIQPYNTVVRECKLSGNLHSILDGPWGIGILNDANSTVLSVENCDVERLGAVVYLRQYPYSLKMTGGGGEQLKKILYSPGSGASQSLTVYHISSARYSMAGAQTFASEGGLDVFAIGDTDAINVTGTGTLTLQSLILHDGYDSYDTRISVFDNDVVSIGCHYGKRKPFHRANTYNAGKRGRTYSFGDTAQTAGSTQESLPTLRGAENGLGSVTISDTNTFADVTFASLTHGGNEITGAADYQVDLAISDVSGTPTISTPYCKASEKLVTGFKIRLSAAPGSGNSVTVSYTPHR